MTFPSDPLSLMAERRPSKKLVCFVVSILCIGISATCNASRQSVVRLDPTAPTSKMLPLKCSHKTKAFNASLMCRSSNDFNL